IFYLPLDLTRLIGIKILMMKSFERLIQSNCKVIDMIVFNVSIILFKRIEQTWKKLNTNGKYFNLIFLPY
ncbi:hypothetical protein Anas_11928, partial [Armadillidium nasatum]